MILKQNQNTPVAAPQFNDLTAVLEIYRTYRGNYILQISQLVDFVTSPSPEREEFLTLLNVEFRTMNNKYIKQIYSAI